MIDPSQMTNEQLLNMLKTNPVLQEQYNKLLKSQQAQQSRYKPLNSEEYLKLKEIKAYLDEEGGMMIEPAQAFVIKTHYKNGEKLFINIVTHWIIDEPEEKQFVDMQNQQGIRVPMSVGVIRDDRDKKSELCRVVDVVINPNVANNLKVNVNIQMFFYSLLANYLLEKYKVEVKPEYTLPKLKYKGSTMQVQRVKGKKPPKINIINENSGPKNPDIDEEEEKPKTEINKDIYQNKIVTPKWTLYMKEKDWFEYDGDYDIHQLNEIKLKIELPALITGKFIDLKISDDDLGLKAGKIYQLHLRFPVKVLSAEAEAKFDCDNRVLYIQVRNQPVAKAKNDQENGKYIDTSEVSISNNLLYDII